MTAEKLPQHTQKIALLTDKLELANLANEAANSLLDSLNEWQFHLMDAPELAASEQEHETIWLWQDGIIPPELENLVHNTNIAAQALANNVSQLADALAAARRDKDQDSSQIDRISTEFGIFVARTEQIAAVWQLIATAPSEDKEPLAKWISHPQSDK